MTTLKPMMIMYILLSVSLVSIAQTGDENNDHRYMSLATTKNMELAVSNYVMGLKSDNIGVVESSLYYSLQLRLVYPDLDYSVLEKEIDRLVVEGATPAIRFKAHIACTVCASPALIDIKRLEGLENMDQFFAACAEELKNKLLVRTETTP